MHQPFRLMDLQPRGCLLATFFPSVNHFPFGDPGSHHDRFAGIRGANMRVFLGRRLGNDAES